MYRDYKKKNQHYKRRLMKLEEFNKHKGKRINLDNVKSYPLVEYWEKVLYGKNKYHGTSSYALGCLDAVGKHSQKDGWWENDKDYIAGYNRYKKGDK